MQYASVVLEEGGSVVVDASGKPLGKCDATTRVLHLLPQLFVPREFLRWLDVSNVELQIISDLQLAPSDGLLIRQPMPNRRYIVGCSTSVRYGWFVPLPESISDIPIEFLWRIYPPSEVVNKDGFEVRHKLNLSLIEHGDGNTYTMSTMCWPLDFRRGRLHAWLGITEDDSDSYHSADRDFSTTAYQCDDNGLLLEGFLIEERASLPPIKLDQLWSVHQFEKEQIHELIHQCNFTNKELHEKNAICCLPSDVFVLAVQLAQSVDFDQGSDFFGNGEEHPANKLLAEWWQKNNPSLIKHSVGFAMPWVRVEDDDRYWCGYYETPDESMELFAEGKSAQARVDDFVLLRFYARKEHFIPLDCGVTLMLANGEKDANILGIESEEHDEAWYALHALRSFPRRFPEAWRSLVGSLGAEVLSDLG